MSRLKVTNRQVLRVIKNLVATGVAPTRIAIAMDLGMKSEGAVGVKLNKLAKLGLVTFIRCGPNNAGRVVNGGVRLTESGEILCNP